MVTLFLLFLLCSPEAPQAACDMSTIKNGDWLAPNFCIRVWSQLPLAFLSDVNVFQITSHSGIKSEFTGVKPSIALRYNKQLPPSGVHKALNPSLSFAKRKNVKAKWSALFNLVTTWQLFFSEAKVCDKHALKIRRSGGPKTYSIYRQQIANRKGSNIVTPLAPVFHQCR